MQCAGLSSRMCHALYATKLQPHQPRLMLGALALEQSSVKTPPAQNCCTLMCVEHRTQLAGSCRALSSITNMTSTSCQLAPSNPLHTCRDYQPSTTDGSHVAAVYLSTPATHCQLQQAATQEAHISLTAYSCSAQCVAAVPATHSASHDQQQQQLAHLRHS